MYCQYCGIELPDNSNFCSNCGKQLGVTKDLVKEKAVWDDFNDKSKNDTSVTMKLSSDTSVINYTKIEEEKKIKEKKQREQIKWKEEEKKLKIDRVLHADKYFCRLENKDTYTIFIFFILWCIAVICTFILLIIYVDFSNCTFDFIPEYSFLGIILAFIFCLIILGLGGGGLLIYTLYFCFGRRYSKLAELYKSKTIQLYPSTKIHESLLRKFRQYNKCLIYNELISLTILIIPIILILNGFHWVLVFEPLIFLIIYFSATDKFFGKKIKTEITNYNKWTDLL